MAGGISQDSDGMITDINVTPLVDIMLVLLIVFMLTADLMDKQAIHVELPKAATGESATPTTLALTLTKNRELYLNGVLTTEANLRSGLPAAVAKDAQIQAIIAADKDVPHGEVIHLIDLIRQGGIYKFALDIEPQAQHHLRERGHIMKHTDWLTYGGTIAVSLTMHVVFLQDMQAAADKAPPRHLHRVEMTVVQTKPSPPPPPPPPLPEPPKPKPKPPQPHALPKPQPLMREPQPKPHQDLPPPPPNAPPPPPDAPAAPPMFGISMSSTVGASKTGFAVPTGNTTMTGAKNAHPGAPAAPLHMVPAYNLSRQPDRIRNCEWTGPYPAEARSLHIEGHIVLEVEVQADGKVTDVKILHGLGHGLDEATLQAFKRCEFSPGYLNGKPVATRIEYVYTWTIEDN